MSACPYIPYGAVYPTYTCTRSITRTKWACYIPVLGVYGFPREINHIRTGFCRCTFPGCTYSQKKRTQMPNKKLRIHITITVSGVRLHVTDLMRMYFLVMTNYWLMSIHQHTGDVKKRHTKIALTFPWVCIDLTYIKHKQTKWRMRVRAVHGYIDNKCV